MQAALVILIMMPLSNFHSPTAFLVKSQNYVTISVSKDYCYFESPNSKGYSFNSLSV